MLKRLLAWIIIGALPASAAERIFDFSETAVDQLPVNFRSALAGHGQAPQWKVILDEVAPKLAPLSEKAPVVTRRGVLAQLNRDAVDERFPLLIYDGETYSDFKLTTHFKLVSGVTEQMAGLAFRLQDEKNFYVIRASGLGNNVRFYKVVNGERSAPIGPELPVTAGVWHELAIECKANKIDCTLDGHPALPTLTDNTFVAGKFALWTKSDSLSYFSDVKVIYTPRVPMVQLLVTETLERNPRLVDLQVYTRGDTGEPRVAACKNAKDLGGAGGKYEKDCLKDGTIFQSKDRETVSVVMPLKDNNGEVIAAVRLRMNSFFGQTEQATLARARPILKGMQGRIQNFNDLVQ